MEPVFPTVFRAWPWDPGLLLLLVVTLGIYGRGWLHLRQRDPARWPAARLFAFAAGLAILDISLASPIETLAFFSLPAHMLQHLLLMMAVPPLLWLGNPLLPMLRGLPASARTYWVAPLFRSPLLRLTFVRLTRPYAAWLLFVGTTIVWHLPPLYERALRSDDWHYLQHIAFFGTGLLFWYVVVRPYPGRPRWSGWLLIPYLLAADLMNTGLAAILCFSDRVLYAHYESVPALVSSALDEQAAAGAMMWVAGSVAYLVPMIGIAVVQFLGAPAAPGHPARKLSLPLVPSAALDYPDLLRTPWLGGIWRSRWFRLSASTALFALSVMVVWAGLAGPELSPMNLAGVLPWIHWRGVIVLGLLLVGNLFCAVCPFTLARRLARGVLPTPFTWPKVLRNKWPAVALLVTFFWAYEVFSLWDSPWLTSWIIVGYYVACLAVDGLFKGASFCKYVCPIGQFNFIYSLLSPWQLRPRVAGVCNDCQTKDCLRGNKAQSLPGCELALFIPRKSSNLDCTLCLDCVRACPHDNVALLPGAPSSESLFEQGARTGRNSLAALVVVLCFAAFANAAGMVKPVLELEDDLQGRLHLPSSFWVATTFYGLALVVLPFAAMMGAAWLSRRGLRSHESLADVVSQFAHSLIPIGFAMWLSHYSFHFFSNYDAAVPVVQQFAADVGISLGEPEWACSCCRPPMPWLTKLELIFLDLGLLFSLYCVYRTARSRAPDFGQTLQAAVSWAVMILTLFGLGIWIVLQPMQMRGVLPGGL